MKIDWQQLNAIINTEDLHGISIGAAVRIVRNVYCGPMGVQGMCTGHCQSCAASLRQAFQLQQAKNPQALLTWMLKNQVSANQETAHQKAPVIQKKNKYGVPTPEKNSFDRLFSDLGV